MSESQQKVVVRYLGDHLVKGYLVHFIPEQDSFRVLTVGAGGAPGEVIEVPFAEIKAIFFVRSFEGDSSYQSPSDEAGFVPPPKSAYRLDVTFRDQELIRGTTEIYNPSSKGFFFTPLDPRDNNLRIYVPRGSIQDVTYRRLLGNILVRQRSITQKQLEQASVQQKNQREELIGRILVEEKIIDHQTLDESLARQKETENKKLGEILIEQKQISRDQLEEALRMQSQNREVKLGEILVANNFVSRRQVYGALASQYRTVLLELAYVSIDAKVVALVSKETARRFKVIPVGQRSTTLHVATSDPGNTFVSDYLGFETRQRIKFVVAVPVDISRALGRYYP